MAPLRRKPKQLDEAPTAFSLGNGGGVLLAGGGGRDRSRVRGRAGGTTGETDEQGRTMPLADITETVTGPARRAGAPCGSRGASPSPAHAATCVRNAARVNW